MTRPLLGDLWTKAASGDAAAFAQFYQRHADRVFTHCYYRLGSRHDAEDLVAEVFAITWRRRSRVVPHAEADILPWLLTTANNLLRHHHRSIARAKRLLRHIPSEDSTPDFSLEIVEQAGNDLALATIVIVLGQLRVAEKEIIQLCVLDGLSPATVAAVTGEPPGTVRSRLSRALARARAAYQELSNLQECPRGGEGE